MSDTQFDDYIQALIKNYAQEHVDAGNWSADEAPAKAAAQIAELLPDGVATPDHYIYAVEDTASQEQVGILWLAVQDRAGRRSAFIYDIEIFEPYQRRGYGTQTMAAAEAEAKKLALVEIALHVFGSNDRARALYRKVGFKEVDVLMSKSLT
jgi:ribosomal protein S18 acetylase RimI-like enzyme